MSSGPSNPRTERLHRIWTQVGIAAGFIASVVTIISFLGIHPPEAKKPSSIQKPDEPPTPPKKDSHRNPLTASNGKSRGIGTFHLEGGFPAGQNYIAKSPLLPSPNAVTVTLLKPGGGEETLEDSRVFSAVEQNQSVGVWRKGLQFVRGLKLTASSPTARLKFGDQTLDVPLDSEGRLAGNVIWPVNGMFTSVEIQGPCEISGIPIPGGLTFGEADAPDNGRTLPTHFKLDLPRPGEVVNTFKGELQYPGGADERRFITVDIEAPDHQSAVSWSTEFNRFGATVMRDDRNALFDRGLYGIKVLYSSSPD